MNNIDRFLKEDFIPSDEDIVRSRQRTTGAYITRFVKNKYAYSLIDVGGQLPERRKWDRIINQGLDAIIYFAALDEYNMVSAEDTKKHKMQVYIYIIYSFLALHGSLC